MHTSGKIEIIQQPVLDDIDRQLIALIAHGLPLSPRPYEALAKQLEPYHRVTEQQIIDRIQQLQDIGYIKRYGVVVRHHELGYTANGMVVWDICDNQVNELGHCIGKFDCVTLSYRRPRRLPEWPYNLFTMVHGRSRDEVIARVNDIVECCELHDIQHEILFSTRRFKQRGARYQKTLSRHIPCSKEVKA
jgi:DNA-binding Lrp family transcriptional regulator